MAPAWRDRAWLALMMAAFLAWHAPLMARVRPGQDEDLYGVPGMTILRTGVPQIPYVPSRDPGSIYYGADVALYALPPLGFYAQALVHLVLGDGIGPARLASTLAGFLAAWLVYDLSRIFFADARAGLLGAGAFVFSRAFAFPATMARPDMLAAALGLLAIRQAARYRDEPRPGRAAGAGAAAGLALLAHPFGVVPAAQVGAWLLFGPVARRWRAVAVYGLATAAGFGLWLPLIALHPDLFRIQFGGNVTGRAGPGLLATVAHLPAVLALQAGRFVAFVMPAQAVLYGIGIVWAVLSARRAGRGRELLYHLAAGSVLLGVLMGRHPAVGYFVYPVALMSVAVGRAASVAAARMGRHERAAAGFLAALLLLAMVPGSGVRVLVEHLRHWDDPGYDVRKFARLILPDLPDDELTAADSSLVLEFYLAGRPVVAAYAYPFYFDARREPFTRAVLDPEWPHHALALMPELEPLRSYGDPSDPFALHATLYRREGGAESSVARRPRGSAR